MNYFGLFFSFTMPGIVVGIMIAIAVVHGVAARCRTEQRQKPQRGLYIENMKEEAQHEA